ncbi:MAG: hypothetical protein JWO44_782 [Bacteroidetes bacterium]|nr:hypothetical protein [Bacteroidota bacterium]
MKNMKKILTLSALVLATSFAFGQDDAASKHVRFGLMVSPSVNWLKSGEKIIEKNGSAMRFGGGLGLEFRLTNVAVFATGLMINTSGGKVKYRNDLSGNPSSSYIAFFYDKENDEIAEFQPAYDAYTGTSTGSTRYDACLINERKYSITYVTLPLTLKLRTKEIGALTYFGMFGINSSFRVAAKATDEVQRLSTSTGTWQAPETISKSDVKKDVALFNEALNMGLGVEWNLSGSTSLVIGANYLLGFTNVVKNNSDYLQKFTEGGPGYGAPLKQSLKSNSIGLTIGVLF